MRKAKGIKKEAPAAKRKPLSGGEKRGWWLYHQARRKERLP